MALPISKTSGSAMLDDAPPSPSDKIYEKPVQPGDATRSLLGGDGVNPEDDSNPALSDPANKILLSVSMYMQATNIAESAAPGFVPDFVKQWIAVAMEQAPLMAQQMSQQGNPAAMLAAVGGSLGSAAGPAGGPGAMPPMGMQAMGLGGGAPMGAGMPNGSMPGSAPSPLPPPTPASSLPPFAGGRSPQRKSGGSSSKFGK